MDDEIDKAEYISKEDKIKFKKLADILKIVINSTFGQFNDQYSFLYDPLALFKTTINGQLYLLKVCEQIILLGCKIISCNTDGIVAIVPNEIRDKYFKIAEETFNFYDITCEFTEYKKYIRTSVNDYITIKGKYNEEVKINESTIKRKGFFVTNKLDLHDGYAKGFDMPIIPLAVSNYFLYDIPVSKTIKNHKDIYDFCTSSNIDKKFIVVAKSIKDGEIKEEVLQKHLRCYVSNSGYAIVKRERGKQREISLIAKHYLTPLNDYVYHFDFNKYNINYNFYIKKAIDVINDIKGLNTKIIKKQGGNLFD